MIFSFFFKLDVDIKGVNKETALHMYARRFPWTGKDVSLLYSYKICTLFLCYFRERILVQRF